MPRFGAERKRRDKREGVKGKIKIFRKKPCKFCMEKIEDIDYLDYPKFQKFLTERGKIIPSRRSGNCAKHQRQIARAIKKARVMSLLPFVAE